MRNKSQRKGFSLIEVIAAVIILAVVATATVATISPMREKSRRKLDDQNIATLNGTVQAYYMEMGAWPDRGLTYLKTQGFTTDQYQKTPYGGYYTFDTTTLKVVNTYAPKAVVTRTAKFKTLQGGKSRTTVPSRLPLKTLKDFQQFQGGRTRV